MMINTAYKHEEDFTKEIASSIYQAQNNELPLNISRLYILQYVMCIEELLEPGRIDSLLELSSEEGSKLVKDVRMKCWNLLIYWSIYPIDLESNIKNLLRVLGELKENRRTNAKILSNLDLEIEGYTSNLVLKSRRLVLSYSRYYYTISQRSGTTEYLQTRIPARLYPELSVVSSTMRKMSTRKPSEYQESASYSNPIESPVERRDNRPRTIEILPDQYSCKSLVSAAVKKYVLIIKPKDTKPASAVNPLRITGSSDIYPQAQAVPEKAVKSKVQSPSLSVGNKFGSESVRTPKEKKQ